MNTTYGPQDAACDAQHAEKYRGPGESFEAAMNRVASVLAPGDHYKPFRDILLNMRFLPAGRVQSAIGSTRNVTAFNCYVSGTIEDSLWEGEGSILQRFQEGIRTLQMGGGVGFDFSTLRFRGADIKRLGTHSAGPIPFMRIFDSGCACISAAGHRRGAQMGVMRIDHPDIEEFIYVKQNENALTNFNISIAVTDEFMEAVRDGLPFWLKFGGVGIRQIDARALWEMVMRSTWDWGEPGVLFIDRINEMNNLWYCEKIAASNPCGEQPLPPFGACLLGSFNLTRYIKLNTDGAHPVCYFDFGDFADDIVHVVRAMDMVIDVSTYPLPEQEQEAKSKRRMGLGYTGLANAIEALGYSYGSDDFLRTHRLIAKCLRNTAYEASIELAKEKGAFPLFDADRYLESKFVQSLPRHIQEDIREHGIRNSHLLSIAPAGTISLCADNLSSGCEPVFAHEIDRKIIGPDLIARTHRFVDYGVRHLGVRGKLSSDVTVEEHLAVLSVAQRYVDSAVSKTCNVTGDMSWTDFTDIYMNAWAEGAKGCTTFNADGKRGAVLTAATEEEEATSCRIDEVTGRRVCD